MALVAGQNGPYVPNRAVAVVVGVGSQLELSVVVGPGPGAVAAAVEGAGSEHSDRTSHIRPESPQMGVGQAAASHDSGNVARADCSPVAAGRICAERTRRWPGARGPRGAVDRRESDAGEEPEVAGDGAAAETNSCCSGLVSRG